MGLQRTEKIGRCVKIAAQLGVGYSTVRRAYDAARPENVRDAANRGEKITVKKFQFYGDRERVRFQATQMAMEITRRALLSKSDPEGK